MQIRSGTEADLAEIAVVLVDTWRTTFAGLLPADYLDSLSYSEQQDRHGRTMRRPRVGYVVAVENDALVGFACGGPNRRADPAWPGELYALYVTRQYQGRGAGSALLAATASFLQQSDNAAMVAWVLDNNPFRGFYERMGGRKIAREPAQLGSATMDQIAYGWTDLNRLSA